MDAPGHCCSGHEQRKLKPEQKAHWILVDEPFVGGHGLFIGLEPRHGAELEDSLIRVDPETDVVVHFSDTESQKVDSERERGCQEDVAEGQVESNEGVIRDGDLRAFQDDEQSHQLPDDDFIQEDHEGKPRNSFCHIDKKCSKTNSNFAAGR